MEERPDIEPLIGAEGTEAPGEPRRSGEAKQRCIDEMLDAALACTFPASDPIGCIRGIDSACEATPADEPQPAGDSTPAGG